MQYGTTLFFPPFRLDLLSERLWRESQEIILRPKTFVILRYLAEHPERLITKDELLRAVWGDTQVSDEGLRDYVREIRQALNDDAEAPKFIETVRGRGYRFLPTVTTPPVQGLTFKVQDQDVSDAPSRDSAICNPHSAISLVGRESELLRLQQLLEKAANGERQLVFVTGEPGIGKTALVEAFVFGVRSSRQFGVDKAASSNQPGVFSHRTPSLEPPSTPGVWLGWG